MDNEARKDEIRRRLILSRYPTRSSAKFTDENDHNPTVLAACPSCRGNGKYSTRRATPTGYVHRLHSCDDCDGSGVTAKTELYFDNDNDPIPINARSDGWTKCPKCGWRFTVTDKNAFTGLRHVRCGQKLLVTRAN